MAELSEGEKQSLDDALSTLDDLYEVTLKPDGRFTSEQMEAIAKLAEEAMGCVLSVLDPEMYDAVQRDCPEKKLGREARAVRILTLFDETPQKTLAAVDTADLLRRRLSLDETVAVPLLLATDHGAAIREMSLALESVRETFPPLTEPLPISPSKMSYRPSILGDLPMFRAVNQ